MKSQHKLTLFVKGIAYKINPKLGRLYESDTKFFNDGIIGFVIGVPITFLLYQPIAGSIQFHFLFFDLTWMVQLLWFITSALFSFGIQHFLRRKWVFKSD